MKASNGYKSFRFNLGLISQALENCGKSGSQCCGISKAQWDVLLVLGVRGELSLVDLAKALHVDTSTLSRTVNGMVILGLVERNQNQYDRRFVAIRMTASGQTVLNHIETIYNDQLQRLMVQIPKEDHGLVESVISQLAEAVEKMDQDYESICCNMGGLLENAEN